MHFLNFCKFHKDPIKMNETRPEQQFRDGHYNTVLDALKTHDTSMYISLKLLDIVYLFTYMTLN